MAYFFKYNLAVVKVLIYPFWKNRLQREITVSEEPIFVFLVHVQLVSEKAFLKLLAIDTKNL